MRAKGPIVGEKREDDDDGKDQHKADDNTSPPQVTRALGCFTRAATTYQGRQISEAGAEATRLDRVQGLCWSI